MIARSKWKNNRHDPNAQNRETAKCCSRFVFFFSEKNNWLMFLIACLFFSSSFPEQSFHSLLHLNLVLEGSVNPAIFNWEREWEQIFSKFEASQRRVQRQFSFFFIEIFLIWNLKKMLLFFAMCNKHTSLTSRSIPEENNSQLDNWLFFLQKQYASQNKKKSSTTWMSPPFCLL